MTRCKRARPPTIVCVTLLVGGCGDMEFPLSDTPLALPGLSYVGGAAEQTLSFIAPSVDLELKGGVISAVSFHVILNNV